MAVKLLALVYAVVYTPKEVKPGILGDKTMGNKLMYIPNDVKQNYTYCRSKAFVKKSGVYILHGIPG